MANQQRKTLRVELPDGAVVPVEPVAAPTSAPSVPVASSPPGGAAPAERFYRVQRTCRVPADHAYYTLNEGQVIGSGGYDIDELRRLGVPLETATGRDVGARAQLL